jgi:hypothetical protein
MALPPLHFLTSSPDYTDYRPAVDASGELVVFERTALASRDITFLTSVWDFSAPQTRPLLSSAAAPLPPCQTRPDWCWQSGGLLFNGSETNNTNEVTVWQLSSMFSTPTVIPNTSKCYYPTWNLAGTSFVTENDAGNPGGNPGPCNSIFDMSGTITPGDSNIDGNDPNQAVLFGGMPSTSAQDLPYIAFAGQPAIAGWAGTSGTTYDENYNYIILNAQNAGTYSSTPMEPGAAQHLQSYDAAYQARAPAWSPDGKTIAFESNRSKKGYAIYLFDIASNKVTQVTDPALNGQHAKFFPDGSRLILTIHHPGGSPKTRGIAWVDITKLLNP